MKLIKKEIKALVVATDRLRLPSAIACRMSSDDVAYRFVTPAINGTPRFSRIVIDLLVADE
jgi:hypothetical protein